MADQSSEQLVGQPTKQPHREPVEVVDQAVLGRLRKLLGAERLEQERQKGRDIRKQAEANTSVNLGPLVESTVNIDSRSANPLTVEALAELDLNFEEPSDGAKVVPSSSLARIKSPYSATTGSDSDDAAVPFGREAEPDEVFCPIVAVSRYPYRYLEGDKEFMEIVAAACFNNGKYWERKWTVFCLLVPQEISERPLFLVTLKEVELLFADIHPRVNKKLRIPTNSENRTFRISFDANEPKPFLLGVSRSRAQYDTLVEKALQGDFLQFASASTKTVRAVSKAFQEKIEKAFRAAKNKKSKGKAKTPLQKITTMQKWSEQLHHAQSYLGLRAPFTPVVESNDDLLADDQDPMALTRMELVRPTMPPGIDVNRPPAFSPWMDVVIISIDLEVQDRNHSIITELGIATLDTRDIANVAPGSAAVNWRDLAKYRHYRIEEYSSHRNEFVASCPDRFEKKFGTSEFIRRQDIAKVMALSCKTPFHTKMSDLISRDDGISDAKELSGKSEPRSTVLIGHNVGADVGFLKSTGLDIKSWSGLLETVDTVAMQRGITRDSTALGLGGLLNFHGIDAWNLHNAGNDAAYTLQAFMAMAVEHLADPKYRKTEEDEALRYAEAKKNAGNKLTSHPSTWIVHASQEEAV